ncbi:MAG: hypothetical protein RJA61_392, partial [Candidatus Parcubacteria bacterium]
MTTSKNHTDTELEGVRLDLSGGDIEKISKIVMGLGDVYSFQDYVTLKSSISPVLNEGLSFEVLEHFLRFYVDYLIFREGKSYFGASSEVAFLLKKDSARANTLITEVFTKFSNQYPGSDSFEDAFDNVLEDVFMTVGGDRTNTLYVTTLSLIHTVTKKETQVILQNSARLLFSMLISQGVEKSDTVLYKNFYALVQEVKIPMDIKSVCNSSFVNTFNMERILPFLDYIAEDEKGKATFYAYYLQKAVQEAEFDLAETLLSHVGEKQEEYVVLTKETSALFAEAVAFLAVSQGDEAKECFSLFKKIKLQPIDTERVLAQFIGLAVNQNDQEWVEEMITLLPEKITWGVLAYNLACYFASIS